MYVPFGVASELVTQNGDPVDDTTCLEMLLYLLRVSGIIDLYEGHIGPLSEPPKVIALTFPT